MEQGKIFLLFGSTGDLGRYASEYFLNQKYDFYYFFARKKYPLPEITKKLNLVIFDDAGNEEEIQKAFSQIEYHNSVSYHLLSTIGGFSGGSLISETDLQTVQSMLKINFVSSFLIVKHFSLFIRGTGGGAVSFISSMSSMKAEAGKAAYNISKNALNYLVQTLALEGKKFNLRANAVAPFAIDTESNREWIDDTSRLVTPKRICEVVKSLFDDENATGKIIQL